ncbi:hypothetical protein LCGC14_1234640 [marine sediment metagenome]|uniref:B12-binding domain-containing protein n=1 Tax=marine sediment metagenome TaxID=412755 RepID=A0A0F9L7H1_9ZZZZ
MNKNRILFGASYSAIEPLGLLHLGGLARDLGWERSYHLVKDHNFEDFFEIVNDYKPFVVGFNVYTGNHLQLKEAFEHLKKDYPGIMIIVGGPHPTYFPRESKIFADYVVMSEGFYALKGILEGRFKSAIWPPRKSERFPHPDRKTFYDLYPEHANSKIKSIITMTGCPYTCTYCYNSSKPEDIDAPELLSGVTGRLFPNNIRPVEDVIKEGLEIKENWPTEIIYCQDDVHGMDTKHWLPEFVKEWKSKVNLPYHAQMRWEMTKGANGTQRLEMLREAGCFGLTLAIESADKVIRKEILSRGMDQSTMFTGMKKLIDFGFKVRTEQITGLPYGATSEITPMNLRADLDLVKLNVDLKKITGGPTMAWASTFAPYRGTKLGSYCEKMGHYSGDNSDVPDTFFEESILRFPRKWVGLGLEHFKHNNELWLSESELSKYRKQNAELRRIFNFVCLVPRGDELAENYLLTASEFNFNWLSIFTDTHFQNLAASGDYEAIKTLDLSENLEKLGAKKDVSLYLACLPKASLAVSKVQGLIDEKSFSTAIRHHLYDNVLYKDDNMINEIDSSRASDGRKDNFNISS